MLGLADQRGVRGVLLFFVRSSTCPVCAAHVRDLAARREAFTAADVEVIVVLPEDRATATTWREKRNVPFRMVTGRVTAHDAVGLTTRVFGTLRQSGSVLVDPAGVVRHAHGATLPTSSDDRTGIMAAVAELTTHAGPSLAG